MKLGLIMLAAGNSRRFGSNKLLYTIEGEPMYPAYSFGTYEGEKSAERAEAYL